MKFAHISNIVVEYLIWQLLKIHKIRILMYPIGAYSCCHSASSHTITLYLQESFLPSTERKKANRRKRREYGYLVGTNNTFYCVDIYK